MSRLLYIDGQWQAADSGAVLRPIAPAAREALPEVACAGVSDVERAVAAARRAFADWKLTSAAQRAGYLRAFAEQLEARSEALITLQMQASGKPRLEAEIDIGDAIATFAYWMPGRTPRGPCPTPATARRPVSSPSAWSA